MPFAMFFNWKPDGHDTGLAIHAASGDDVAQLGSRASAGCVRLAPDNAETLFGLVRSLGEAPTPILAYRPTADELSSEGLMMHEPDGTLQMQDNYPVLVLIDDYHGGDQISALR